MELPNLPRNWDMLLFVVGWFTVFFAPQQNKILMMFAWSLIITGIVLGILNYVDYEMRHAQLHLTDEQSVWLMLIIFVIWICALGGCYTMLLPVIYPNLI